MYMSDKYNNRKMGVQKHSSEHIVQIQAEHDFGRSWLKNLGKTPHLKFSQRYTIFVMSILYYVGFVPFRFHTSNRSTSPPILTCSSGMLEKTFYKSYFAYLFILY